jgi:hypothetical protein
MKKIFLTAIFLLMAMGTIIAQKTLLSEKGKNGWNKIGETVVTFQSETAEIEIANSNPFKAIKFQVKEAPIFLESFDVHFAQGGKQTFLIGGFNPVYLDGDAGQVITKIVFRYKSMDARDKRARVEILGWNANPKIKIENKVLVVN